MSIFFVVLRLKAQSFQSCFSLFQKPDYSKYQRFDTPFDDFFAEEIFGNKHSFSVNRRSSGDDPDGPKGPNTFHKQSITSKAYYNTILPNR